MTQQPLVFCGLLIIDHLQTRHIRYDSSWRVINPTQKPLPDNKRHVPVRDSHAADGIRTRNPSKLAAADPRLRKCGHSDRLFIFFTFNNSLVPLTAYTSN
jgi:hypothetical protein